MDIKLLIETTQKLMADSKGLLAMDESLATCNSRFEKLMIPQTEEYRRAYRELIITTPNLSNYISGTILFDETIRESAKNGELFVNILNSAGIVIGIKVDRGAKDNVDFPNEKITEGLDGLPERLKEYFKMGARFAKWRAVIKIGEGIPTLGCIDANMFALAHYALMCQEAGLVPIVEPEVLMDGDHTMKKCGEVTEIVLQNLFARLLEQMVDLRGIILKPNMILPGMQCPVQNSVDEVADATVSCFLKNVPAEVPGIAFLSGGQSGELASMRLNAMNAKFKSKMPWALTFSFSRAIQNPALKIWSGKDANVLSAQKALLHRAKCNSFARRGEYNEAVEKEE